MTNELDNQQPGPEPQGNSGGLNDWVSALADGQLRGREFARAVADVAASGDARATWHAYHVVGDVLRSGDLVACADDAAFLARFQSRLQREAASALPLAHAGSDITADANSNDHKSIANNVSRTWRNGINSPKNEGGADSRSRWKLLAGVASMAAVGAIGWNLLGGPSGVSGPAGTVPAAEQLAQAPEQPQVMIRDPRLDALLAAHKQFGGTSALQMPAGFLRNATFENPGR